MEENLARPDLLQIQIYIITLNKKCFRNIYAPQGKKFWPRGYKTFSSTNSYSKSYSVLQIILVSRSRGYKTFSYSYSYPSGVQISDFLSKLHSLLRTILKAVSVRNIISNEIYQAEFNKRFQFFICSPNII